MTKRYYVVVITIVFFLLAGCAHQGPVVPKPPSIRFTHFNSTLITPDIIKFQVKLAIKNQMRAKLDIQKIDYTVDLQGKPLFADSFNRLNPMKGRGRQVVTFPFQIAMKDIMDQAVDVLTDEGIRVRFRGQVYPAGDFGFAPIPFAMTRTIPLPRMPAVTVEGTEGSPFDKIFTVFLKIENTNTFPLSIKSIDSYMEINQKKYSLLRTQERTEIKPDTAETIQLRMEQSTAKTLSMVLNIVQSESLQFNIGGSIKCVTPYGLIYIPLKLQGKTTQ